MTTIDEILKRFPDIKCIGPADREIRKLVELKSYNGEESAMSWANDKNIHKLVEFLSGVFICSPKIYEYELPKGITFLVHPEPRKLFQKVLLAYFYAEPKFGVIADSATIAPTATLGMRVSIGLNTVIEDDCLVGDNVFIGHNNVILKGTQIGNGVFIGNNNTIGGSGFGYEKDENGNFQLIPHIGNVVIMDDVDVGNNTCIDRGVLGSTVIGKNCKIDNLVHIAHNVVVGDNSVVIANAMIGGSTIIKKNSWIAPSASLINGISVAEGSVVGIGAVVIKSIAETSIVVGNPAKPLQKK